MKTMKKIITIFTVLTVVLGFLGSALPVYATTPTGTLTSATAIPTVNVGQIVSLPALTVTDHATIPQITATNDIHIRIPAGVNAIWDTTVTSPTMSVAGGAGLVVATAVSYIDNKTLRIDVTTSAVGGNSLTISGLRVIGITGASAGAHLTWSVGGAGSTYGVSIDANTNIVVAVSGTHNVLTAIVATPANSVVTTQNAYTIAFTVPTDGVIPATGRIVITFPAGFTVATNAVTGLSGIDGVMTAVVSGQVITITRTGGANALAGPKSLTVNNITNHATADSNYTISVATDAGIGAALASGTSTAFLINPAAITDLTCEPSGQAGAVWLRWTAPVGISHSYEVRFQQGNTINGSALIFAQSWVPGTIGAAQQQLLTGLNPNTQYTFAVRARGAGTSISATSSLTPICFAPASARAAADSIPPITRVTSPAANSNVLAGQPLTIRGTALDAGGSSVQKIEVSLDEGVTWNLARAVHNIEASLIWEFTWQNPVVGTKTIRVRAYDWFGNIESPVVLPVVVTTALPQVSAPIITPAVPAAPTLPFINPVGEVQIKANIAHLQRQLILLLQQLLTILANQHRVLN